MDIKRKTCDIRTWKETFIFRHILHQNWHTCPIALPMRRNLQHRRLLTVVSATSAPPFQLLRHRRNVCHPVVNRFTQQTLPTVIRKNFFMNIVCTESFSPHKTHNRTLLFHITLLKHGRHFDYWNQPLNMRMRVCYLVIYIENLLRPLLLFYFHLWPIYWLSLVQTILGFPWWWTFCSTCCQWIGNAFWF
jgi:hypothetical protein